jgi:hypothetical protein
LRGRFRSRNATPTAPLPSWRAAFRAVRQDLFFRLLVCLLDGSQIDEDVDSLGCENEQDA